ncbi:hypothetical protein C5B85_18280 [Pseudoclavibacter sp. AY1F1]|uniref:hypothetical protein n=1 Tax=Pseudoclavibacter sp. AY1F1 TaxID=2080583 RepID=UPI000CE89BD2|nr:hypothetical protein [Pseudoclavibacter sp. AY1F1]PPF41869.1 hypothetical protein C5B85_18280 [Pseudoclavibacter sp. AY1F1]
MRDVLVLHKKHKRTLGFLPDSAFRERAERGWLVLAYQGLELAGYLLYNRKRAHIKLLHVCVADSHRGQSLALRMLDEVILANPNSAGVEAHCRRSYGLHGFWESMGMSPRNERPGRGLLGEPLDIWWRPLGGPDLFENLAFESARPLAVLDANVVIDLVATSSVQRPNREASQALMADWLQEYLAVAISPAVDLELNALEEAAERAAQRVGAAHLARVGTRRPRSIEIETELRARIGETEWQADPSLAVDVRHLADAVNADATYFVTNDVNLIRLLKDYLKTAHELHVMKPHEVVLHVHAPEPASWYQPEHLSRVLRLGSGAASSIDGLERLFVNASTGERAKDFRRELEASLASRDYEVRVLQSRKNEDVGLLVFSESPDRINFHKVRVKRGARSADLALQLTRQIRESAVAAAISSVAVTDQHLSREVREALEADGFRDVDGAIGAAVVVAEIDLLIDDDRAKLASLLGNERAESLRMLTPGAVAELERAHWPLKIWDDTSVFLVPIKPEFSMNLFGFPENLLEQRESLGFARRHVYFRSPRNNPIQDVPARLLWYCSSDGRAQVSRVFALSRLVASRDMAVDQAHERFSHMGTYKRSDLDRASHDGVVHVLEFEDTEVFRRPVSLADFRMVTVRHGVSGNPPQSPRRVLRSVFLDLIELSNGAS